jgi:hypothetical protein
MKVRKMTSSQSPNGGEPHEDLDMFEFFTDVFDGDEAHHHHAVAPHHAVAHPPAAVQHSVSFEAPRSEIPHSVAPEEPVAAEEESAVAAVPYSAPVAPLSAWRTIPARQRSERISSAPPAKRQSESISSDSDEDECGPGKQLTEAQKRERNKAHSKNSRLRKKLLIDGLQVRVGSLTKEIDTLRKLVRVTFPGEQGELLLQAINPDTPPALEQHQLGGEDEEEGDDEFSRTE